MSLGRITEQSDNKNESGTTIMSLPMELFALISSWLPLADLKQMRRACRRFQNATRADFRSRAISYTVKCVAVGYYHSYFVLHIGRVYMCGSRNQENAQDGHSVQGGGIRRIEGVPEKITAAAAGIEHVLLLGESGSVYGMGRNSSGQLGLGHYRNMGHPVRIDCLPEKITQVAAGGNYSMFLSESGMVYACGSNQVGELGIKGIKMLNTPAAMCMPEELAGETISTIAAGKWHSALLTASGKVFTCGFNQHGQLGMGHVETLYSLKRVHINNNIGHEEKAVQIALGMAHTLVLTERGQVYVFGDNRCGQLGIGETELASRPVRLVKIDKMITNIFAGEFCSFFSVRDSGIYVCGYNQDNQTGLSHPQEEIAEPVYLEELQDEAAIMIKSQAEHTLFLTGSNKVFASGTNFHGQRGFDKRDASSALSQISFFNTRVPPKELITETRPLITCAML